MGRPATLPRAATLPMGEAAVLLDGTCGADIDLLLDECTLEIDTTTGEVTVASVASYLATRGIAS